MLPAGALRTAHLPRGARSGHKAEVDRTHELLSNGDRQVLLARVQDGGDRRLFRARRDGLEEVSRYGRQGTKSFEIIAFYSQRGKNVIWETANLFQLPLSHARGNNANPFRI